MAPMKQMVKSRVGPRLIGKSLERTKFEVERGMVSQAPEDSNISPCLPVSRYGPSDIERRNLDFRGIWGEAQTKYIPCIHRFLCLMKSEKVKGDFSCISPSMKLKV